jgi:C1A family cysteine protease
MTAVRRTILVLVISIATVLCVLPGAAAAAGTARPQPGPLSPAFVEALHDPMVALGLGHVPSPVEVHVDAATEASVARSALPGAYDLRAQGRLTPVKDQGNWSTCWAFGNVAALESKLMPASPAPDLSEDNLISRSGYFSSIDDRYNEGGYDFMAVAYFARWDGPVAETDDPYDPSGVPSPAPTANTPVLHVQDVTMLPGRATWSDNALIKRLVVQNGALSVGMWWETAAYRPSTASFYLSRARGENHGVDIVGWNDSYSRRSFGGAYGRPPGNGAFLVRNSWNASFGDDGYFWVSYYDRSFAREQGLGGLGGMTSYTNVEPTTNYSAEYQHDTLGVTDHWGYNAPRVWGASKFAAAADQSISAAAFYTLSSSTRYQVWAGPTLKKMTLRASGTRKLPGYATVDFSTPLAVTTGQKFVVAVKLYSPNEAYPLAIERPGRDWPAAVAAAGESFISRDGSRWTDVTRVRSNSSVCLKAFAQ